MRPMRKILWVLSLAMPFLVLNAGNAFAAVDDYTPEVTARVARISYLSGDVKIKRADSDEWERASKNLPVVEGDELATERDSRLEIQFNSESYLRLSENAYLKITTLRDEGIAVSLPNGSLNARLLNFNKEQSYFEIDAPQTTVSVEKSGMYRVDAGSVNDREVRVTATEFGQARVYSDNNGFTLKNGRSATIQIDGDHAGEWETTNASRYADEFDEWALERDTTIAARLARADYDKYYDRDIYGAEDLSENGEWIYTRKYGYVWKPFRTATSSYADWSPYRYGQWRWVAPYGWTWVNDESWGWATYHHGRWVWDNGGWYWSPYAQYRSRRSWWHPALVVVSYIGRSVCWYPLPYGYSYYNYNAYYYDRRRYNRTIINNTTIINNYPNPATNPTPNPNPTPTFNPQPFPGRDVPPTGVIAVDITEFGTKGGGRYNTAPVKTANEVLAVAPSKTKPPELPTIKEVKGKQSKEIAAETPVNVKIPAQTKTGAGERTAGVPIDKNLRDNVVFGNREPVRKTEPTETNGDGIKSPVRSTGAVKRPPLENSPSKTDAPVKQSPSVRETMPNDNPVRPTGGKNREENQPVRPRSEPRETAPTYVPPRKERQEQQQQPTYVPPRREEPVRQEPRNEPPPKREEPRPQPQPKNEPPPRKQEEPAPQKQPAPTETKGKGQ